MFDWLRKWLIAKAHKWEYEWETKEFSKLINITKTRRAFIRWKRDGWISMSIYDKNDSGKNECVVHFILSVKGDLERIS